MIVCHCKAISDRTIRNAVRDGADSPREVARACGAGRTCGGCRPAIRALIRSEKAEDIGPVLTVSTLAVASSAG